MLINTSHRKEKSSSVTDSRQYPVQYLCMCAEHQLWKLPQLSDDMLVAHDQAYDQRLV